MGRGNVQPPHAFFPFVFKGQGSYCVVEVGQELTI